MKIRRREILTGIAACVVAPTVAGSRNGSPIALRDYYPLGTRVMSGGILMEVAAHIDGYDAVVLKPVV